MPYDHNSPRYFMQGEILWLILFFTYLSVGISFLTTNIQTDLSEFFGTGKFVSEELILESVNPQYDDRLFIDLRLQYKKNTNWELVVYKNYFWSWHSKQFLYTTYYEILFVLCCTLDSMNNLMSYFRFNWCKNECFWKRSTSKLRYVSQKYY